jgi:chemotaxis protein CheZ
MSDTTLSFSCNEKIFEKLGKLTRSVYEAVNHFELIHEDGCDEKSGAIKNVCGDIEYVLTLTESAASKTLDHIDSLMPVMHRLKENVESVHEVSHNSEALSLCLDQINTISERLSDISIAQEYQDLTGQVLKRVIRLINDFESGLVDLFKTAVEINQLSGGDSEIKKNDLTVSVDSAINGNGPLVDFQSNHVQNQDDVDDLLSSLGF